ncbi:hypothetical protein [Polaribacter porphyrae]|uniref:Uncharacterized protein n=1 Tax=Polaribacter porphyrae TaxID=1137780 RepID=A0A2S7WM52_9FLAO|nr:hypothetical protein [Polaribacter porphyrae]PQJ78536.1 hypothetical protein BTO18_04750 [Polaribacter porphyrae]
MIKTYENTLRKIIVDILGASDNSDYKIPEEIKEKWLEKRKFEKEKNDGFLFEKRIIYYSDFLDLKTIIIKNWDKFEPIFKNKNRFLVFFEEINQYKNSINQSRALTKSQEEMLSGITTDLKNSYTVYTNKNNNRNDYFLAINTVSDNLGTTWNKSGVNQKPILKVGDEYELLIDANDPKDRDIEYEIYHFAGTLRIHQQTNRFNFKISEELISENTMLVVKVFTPKSKYKNESILKIHITVLPEIS